MATQFNPETLTQIGRYTVVRFLAEGGMSWVFEVSDPEMYDRRVALKLIKPHVLAEGEMLKRYEDEVRLLARIEHPNLVRVYAQGTDAETGARFFTMEFIEGPHLGEVAAEWLIEPGVTTVGVTLASLSEIGEFFLGILAALARVHAQGVYHRDIKPENILITQDGIAKLADFSIARDTHKAGVTRAGLVPGTPQYMSPEQSLDETVGATADLFSLGLALYRVLTGRSIYATELGDETKTQQVIRHLWALYTNHGEFSFEFPEELPPAFHEVIRRACRIDPRGRYQTAREMRDALARALAAPHVASPESPPVPRRATEPSRGQTPRRSRRGLVFAAIAVAGVALLGGLLAVYAPGGRLPASVAGSGSSIVGYDAADANREAVIKRLFSDWDLAWSKRDIGLLRRTQSLTATQEQGFAKVFDDNHSIAQRTRVLDIAKAGENAYEVQLEYSRVLMAGASEKRQDAQKRVARVERSDDGWIISSVTQR